MQCKECTHQLVCMFKTEFDKLEGQLPTTGYPFKSSVTCSLYRQEMAQPRYLGSQIVQGNEAINR
jgi:hypothetical protein